MKESKFVKFMEKLLKMPERKGPRADMYMPDWLMYLGVFLLAAAVLFALPVIFVFDEAFPLIPVVALALITGIITIMCWRNQKVRILNDREFEYTTFLGRKKRYLIEDISRLRRNTDSMTMFVGKHKVHIDAAAIRTERFTKMIQPFLPGYKAEPEPEQEEVSLPSLHLRKGSFVPAADALREGYMMRENGIIANINAEKMRPFADGFIAMHNEPVFFILEIPTSAQNIPEGSENVKLKDVYYIDALTGLTCMNVLDITDDILTSDGLAAFGVGCHESHDEFMMGKYNILTVSSSEPEKYRRLFARLNIPENNDLLTAPETFTGDAPGESSAVTVDGKTIYDLPEILKNKGIYLAERRED